MAEPITQNLTFLLTDIEGFTDKTSRRSRTDIQKLLSDHREIVLPILEAHKGRLVKTIGDAFMMSIKAPRTRSWRGSPFRNLWKNTIPAKRKMTR